MINSYISSKFLSNQCYYSEYYLNIYLNISYFVIGIFICYFLYYFSLFDIIYDRNSFFKFIDKIVTKLIYIKMNIIKSYNYLYKSYYEPYFVEKGFKIENVIVCDDLYNNRTGIRNNMITNELNPHVYKNIIYSTFDYNQSVGMPNHFDMNNDNVYIKIVYKYDTQRYIFVYNNEMARLNIIVPIPLYNENIIEDFKKDSMKPYYEKHNKEASIYSLFHIDCKKIKSVKYNGIDDPNHIDNYELLRNINNYKGLLNDFGLLYKCKLKVKHLLSGSLLDNFKSLEIEFEAPYFDEVTYDIIPHVIKLDSKEDYIISDYIKNILEKRESKTN